MIQQVSDLSSKGRFINPNKGYLYFSMPPPLQNTTALMLNGFIILYVILSVKPFKPSHKLEKSILSLYVQVHLDVILKNGLTHSVQI